MYSARTRTALTLAAVLGLVFCAAAMLQSAPQQPAQRQEQRGQRPMTENARNNLLERINHELVMMPYYGVFDWIEYRLDPDYTVTLGGYVTRPTLKSDAEKLVSKIEGIEKVNNQIEVLPPSGMDDELRQALYRSIFSAQGLDRYALQSVPPIHIIVRSGRVILAGIVRTEGEKNLAGLRANQVSNVFSVDNKLFVEEKGSK